MENFFGKEIARAVTEAGLHGQSIDLMWQTAINLGFTGSKEGYLKAFSDNSKSVYASAPLAHGLMECDKYLNTHKIKKGIVSNSRQTWIDVLASRLHDKIKFDITISLDNHTDLKSKPSPDGYIYAIKQLNIAPRDVLIIEDSTSGVISGLESGAHVVQYLEFTRDQRVTDSRLTYCSNMSGIPGIIEEINRQDSSAGRAAVS